MTSKHASTSKEKLDMPPLSTLRAWVTRKEAIATCRIDDIVRLRTVTEEHEGVKTVPKDVFFLRNFPCQMVELVGFVAGVDRKDTSITVTLDDHSGSTLPIVVFLKRVEVKMPALQQSATTTFRSAQERSAQKPTPKAAPLKKYVVPDVQVGDTVRVVGRVDEWTRPKRSGPEVIRQVAVDLVSDGGSINTVWPDELYEHVAMVRELHRTLYSEPFTMTRPLVSLPPSPSKPSPSKSMLSSIASSESSYDSDEDLELRLRHPSRLSSSRHTDSTFKYYLIDLIRRETVQAMRAALRLSAETQDNSILYEDQYVPALAERFPEYRQAMQPAQSSGALHNALTQSTMDNTPIASRANNALKINLRPTSFTLETPSRSSFARANRERGQGDRRDPIVLSSPEPSSPKARRSGTQADPIVLSSPPKTPEKQASRHVESQRDSYGGSRRRTRRDPGSPTPTRRRCTQCLPASLDCSSLDHPTLPIFTVDTLMKDEMLAVLGPLVVKRRAKKDEAAMRAREANGTSTDRDRRKIQERLAKGRSKGHWKLDKDEMEVKFRNLTTWALRVITEEGGLICISAPSGSKAAAYSESYLPVPPELLAPLMAPMVRKEQARLSNVFRSKAERQKGVSLESDVVRNVTRSLRKWGDGRYERVGDWAVAEAYEWGKSRGLY